MTNEMVKKRTLWVAFVVAICLLFSAIAVTLHVRAEDKSNVRVTFDANGGSFSNTGTDTLVVDYGDGDLFYSEVNADPYLLAPNDHSEFLGWSISKDRLDSGDGELGWISSSKTVYAIWQEYDYVITFDAGEGFFNEDETNHQYKTFKDKSENYLSDYPYEPEWKDTSKKCVGWYLSPDYKKSSFVENPYEYNYSADATLYAKWEDTVTITLNYNGGKSDSWEPNIEEKVIAAKSESVWLSTSFSEAPKSHQIIEGWHDNPAGTGPKYDYQSYDDDITLYAKWVDSYTVTLDMQGGNVRWKSDLTESVQVGKEAHFSFCMDEESNPLSNGKYLAGIYTGPNGTGEQVYAYKQLAPKSYMQSPEWQVSFDYLPTKDTTLYAYWAEPIEATFDVNGGLFLMTNEDSDVIKKKFVQGTSFSETDLYLQKDGYVFVGWSTEKDNVDKIKNNSDLVAQTTYYATWKKGVAVTLNANGGSFWNDSKTGCVTVEKGGTIGDKYVPTPSAEDGYVFAGWFYDQHCQKEVDVLDDVVWSEDITLYAGWTKGIKVTLDANGGYFENGGEKSSTETDYISKGRSAPLYRPDEYPSGKVFAGWYTDKQWNKKVDSNTKFVEDTTLYAKWVSPIKVTFDANGGVFRDGTTIKVFDVIPGDDIDIQDVKWNLNEDNEHYFAGWYLDKECQKEAGGMNNHYCPTTDMTFYAKWGEGTTSPKIKYFVGPNNVYTTTGYREENGAIDEHYASFELDDVDLERVGLDPTKQGVDTHWFVDKNLTTPFTKDTPVGDSICVYGKLVNRYPVTLNSRQGIVYEKIVYVNEGFKAADLSIRFLVYPEDDESFVFDGWAYDEGGKQSVGEEMIAGPLTLYAINSPAYKVDFYGNGGFWDFGKGGVGSTACIRTRIGETLGNGISEWATPEAYATEDNLSRYDDKLFVGWYEDKALTKKVDNILEYVPTSDVTLYAKWERYDESARTPLEPTTKKEEPSTKKQEEPTTKKQDEPTTKKPEEPLTKKDEPTTKKSEEPTTKNVDKSLNTGGKATTKLSGIVKGADGKWAMYKNGVVDTSYTGVAQNENGWWRVEDGYVDFDANGIYQNENGWWKTTNGKVTFNETGVFQNEDGWWRVENSKVNFKANSIYQNKYGWWKTTNGKVTFKEDGIYQNENGWWKTKDSKVDFGFTGIASNKNGTWYVKNGKVDFSKNGKVTYNKKTYSVKNGKVQ